MKTERSDLSVKEVAEVLGASESTVRDLIKRGGLTSYKLGPSRTHGHRVTRESLDEFRRTGGARSNAQ